MHDPDGNTVELRHYCADDSRYGARMDVGDVVDDFELPDETGTPRKLSDLLANGPVVLFFYPAAMTHRVHEGELPLP